MYNKSFFIGKKIMKCWKDVVLFFLIFAIGAAFVLNFSYSTSPLTPFYWGGDTAQFLTIGKEWCNGKIP